MSFAKAEQLLDLATMLRARRSAITLNDVENRFGCSRRTAQRMMRQLEARFPDLRTASGRGATAGRAPTPRGSCAAPLRQEEQREAPWAGRFCQA